MYQYLTGFVTVVVLLFSKHHKLKRGNDERGKNVRLGGFLHILRFWPDFLEELDTTFEDCLAFDFFGIKKNFLISKSVDEIPLMPPEVENDESTSFWLNNIGLAVVVVKKNGSLLMIEFNLLSLPLSLLLFLKILLLNTLLFLFLIAELAYNEFGSEGISLGYLVANFTLFGSIISLKVSNSVWNGSVDFILEDRGETFLE